MQRGSDAYQVQEQGVIPEVCEQPGCGEAVETWCSLCERFYCAEHDELYPRRKHDCLKGRAEVA